MICLFGFVGEILAVMICISYMPVYSHHSKTAKENESGIDPTFAIEAILGMVVGGVLFFMFLFYVCQKQKFYFIVVLFVGFIFFFVCCLWCVYFLPMFYHY